MKAVKSLLTLAFVALTLSLGAQNVYEGVSADTLNKMNANNQKTGYWIERSGEFTNMGSYVDGKKVGNWVTLLSNNLIYKLEYYGNGEKDGISLQFDRKAKLTSLENYKNGQLHGYCSYLGPYNEMPTKEINYANGKYSGMMKLYYENGKIQEESYYKDNVKNGPSRWYSKNSKLIAIYNYVDGKFEGQQRTFYDNDSTQVLSNYTNNLLNGDYKEFYRNGVAKVAGKYMNGDKEGIWFEYDETGKAIKKETYKKGQLK